MTVESQGQSITFGVSESDDGLMVWLGLTDRIPRCEACRENSMCCVHLEGYVR